MRYIVSMLLFFGVLLVANGADVDGLFGLALVVAGAFLLGVYHAIMYDRGSNA